MMIFKKHLKLINKIYFIFFVLFLAVACTEEIKQKEYLARVNDSYFTREELASLVDTAKISKDQLNEIINDWIATEVLYLEANKNGITAEDEYKRLNKKSSRQLAAAMLINSFNSDQSLDITDDDLISYYEQNKNYFRATGNSYLVNKVFFNDKNTAIKFRSLAIENDWDKIVEVFISDSLLKGSLLRELVYTRDIYPLQLARIIQDLNTEEISIVITEKPGYYSVIKLVGRFSEGSILPLDVIKSEVKDRMINEEKSRLIEEYIKEIYSENEIEIRL